MARARHHYIPQTYLRNFADQDQRLRVLLKDAPQRILRLLPREVCHQRYYYSQPLPDGGRDHDKLEDGFSKLEARWPALIEMIRRSDQLTPDDVGELFMFMALLRVRVPAARDAAELYLAESVRMQGRFMEARGMLPPPPKGLEEFLKFDNLEIAIDPHQSLHMMVHALDALGPFFDTMGYTVIRNSTGIPFLSSDNPVVYFDPTATEDALRPYNIRPGGESFLLFPLTSDLILMGSTEHRKAFTECGPWYSDLPDPEIVHKFNDAIARFGYRQLYCQSDGPLQEARRHADKSPVPQFLRAPALDGEYLIVETIFGPRPTKPKWTDKMANLETPPATPDPPPSSPTR